jgi:hypothetical protein
MASDQPKGGSGLCHLNSTIEGGSNRFIMKPLSWSYAVRTQSPVRRAELKVAESETRSSALFEIDLI